MDQEFFKMLVEKQNEWRRQYNANKKNKQIIKTICNRKYRSKGNKDLCEIQKSLAELGFLREVTLVEREYGTLYETVIEGLEE